MATSSVQIPVVSGSVQAEIANNLVDGKQYQVVNIANSSGADLSPLTNAELRATPLEISGTIEDGATASGQMLLVGGKTAGGLAQVFETNASGQLNIADGGGSITVDGTFWQATQPISAVSLPLPAGAATETTLSSINAKTATLVSGRVPVDGSSVTQPVSVSSLPLPSGAASEATLSALNTKTPALGQSLMAASSPVVIASNQTAIPVALPNDTITTYNQTGIIAVNTDLLVIDCQGLEAISIHCTSMGVGGVVTPSWSNTNVTNDYISQSIMTPAGVAVSTFNAVGMWVSVKQARFLRLRLTTATPSGTTTINVLGVAQGLNYPVQVQPVSGTVSVSGGIALNGGTNAIGDVGVQYRPSATGGANASSVLSPVTPVATSLKATAGRIVGWHLVNTANAVRSVKIFNTVSPTLGTTPAVFEIDIPAGGISQFDLAGGIAATTAIVYSVTSAKGLTDNTATGLAVNDVSGVILWA